MGTFDKSYPTITTGWGIVRFRGVNVYKYFGMTERASSTVTSSDSALYNNWWDLGNKDRGRSFAMIGKIRLVLYQAGIES